MTGRPPEPTGASSSASAGDKSTTLSRELRDFLIRFSIALHRYGMYPDGHPSLAPTVDEVHRLVSELLFNKPTLSLGVARSQLVIEGVATDPKNPVLHELATRLHRHHIGAVTFDRGLVPDELHAFLVLAAQDPERSGGPLGLSPEFTSLSWEHLHAYPLNYERLRFVEGETPEGEDESRRARRTRAAQLWLGLARAALAAGAADDADDDSLEDADPAVIAEAIERRQKDNAYDQVIVGYMLQIADELKSGRAQESAALRKRVSDLVSSLDHPSLSRLLSMGGDATQRRRFLLSASQGMAVDAVVDLVEAAGTAGEQTISHSFLRMLQKMARHAEKGRGRRKVVADESIRDQIGQLVSGWELRDPNPGAYGAALQRMSVSAPAFVASSDARYTTEPRRLVEMALELDAVGEPVERAVDALMARGELPWLLETLRLAYAPAAVDALRRRVARVEQIAMLLAADPIDYEVLDELIDAVGDRAAEPLLDALAEASVASTRHQLIARLTRLGPAIAPAILARLDDERWYVVRNLLGLLGEWERLPDEFDPWVFLEHEDPRVRREAIRLLLRDPELRDRAIVAGLRDSDEGIVRLAITTATESCPEAALPLIITRAASGTSTDQRVAAIRVLGASAHPTALSTLLQLTQPRKGFLGEKPPPKTPEYLAALAALQGFRDDERAAAVLERAATSRDADVARASRAVPKVEE